MPPAPPPPPSPWQHTPAARRARPGRPPRRPFASPLQDYEFPIDDALSELARGNDWL